MNANIKGYPNYHVTETGLIFNIKTGSCLKPVKHVDGYLLVSLYDNNKQTSCRIHRLVAEAYLPNPNNLPIVMHLDDDRTNNNISNLRWGTQQENLADRDSKNRQAKGKRCYLYGKTGEKNNNAKLSDLQRKEIVEMYSTGKYTQAYLAKQFSMSGGQVCKIIKKAL